MVCSVDEAICLGIIDGVADRDIDAIIFTPGRDDVEGSLGLGSVVAIVRVSSESKPHVYIICVFHCSEFAGYCSSDFLC